MSLRLENIAMLWGLVPLTVVFGLLFWKRSFRARLRLGFYYLCFVLCLIGLARPQSTARVPMRGGKTSNLFLAVDVSQSMLVNDVRPTRLGFAQVAIERFIERLDGVRMSLFPFAADGYTQVPLTNDLNVIEELIPTLSPALTTDQGTDLTAALQTLFKNISEMEATAQKNGEAWPATQVVLFSDGESHQKLESGILASFRSKQIAIHTVGTGTPEGGKVPFQQMYRLPSNRATVVSKLDETPLKAIAQETGGVYVRSDLKNLEKLMVELGRSGTQAISSEIKIYQEFYPYLFLAAILVFLIPLLSSRWEYVLRALPLMLLPMPSFADGASVEQQLKAIETQLEKETDSDRKSRLIYNRGVYLLQEKKKDQALEAFQESMYLTEDKTLQKKALFNMGNTFLQSGKVKEALGSYQQAMDLKTGNNEFDQSTDKKLSENIALAMRIVQQKGGGGKGGDQQQQPQDQKGPKKNYVAEQFSQARKQRILDLISNEEQNTMIRLQRKRQNKSGPIAKGKPW